MTEDYKKIAESIRSGKYFGDARGWFEAMYIGPVSERTFFLIIAVMAMLISLFAFVSISRFLPITRTQGLLVHAGERPDEVQMTLVPLAPNHAPVNPAILQFFLARYVQLRESFDSRTMLDNAKFIEAQSDTNTYNTYALGYSPSNPQSPFAGLGVQGQRNVTVLSVSSKDSKGAAPGHGSASVVFSTDTLGVQNPDTTKWTANIDYIYTSLDSKMVLSEETKKKELEVTDPHFQVVNYVLQQQVQKPAK